MAEMEQSHSLCENLVRQRDEARQEAEKLKTSFREVERTLGTRERAHRHRVKGLEEQVESPEYFVHEDIQHPLKLPPLHLTHECAGAHHILQTGSSGLLC